MSSINPLSSSDAAYQAASPQSNKQIRTDFKALAEALKSGDLNAAQTAFAALKKDAPELAQKLASQDAGSTESNPFNALAAALDKGDIQAAKTAMASLHKGHHGHHHKKQSDGDGSNSAPVDTTPLSSTTGTLLDAKS